MPVPTTTRAWREAMGNCEKERERLVANEQLLCRATSRFELNSLIGRNSFFHKYFKNIASVSFSPMVIWGCLRSGHDLEPLANLTCYNEEERGGPMIAYEEKLDRDLAWALREGSMHFEKER